MGNKLSMTAVFDPSYVLVYHADDSNMSTYVILHNIRSAHNVGSIFRTADGAGVSKIFLTGYTPAPIDRFGRVRAEIKKTSLGATHAVAHESVLDIHVLLDELVSKGISIVAVEQTNKAVDYKMHIPAHDIAYIFGNEITGIEESVLRKADQHIMIPMLGTKESLNVAVVAGIILFHATK
jgi:23S rRNA (guanosine2251-2'-O)-methyltransferase